MSVTKQLAGERMALCEGRAPVGLSKMKALLLPLLRSSVALFAFVALPALAASLNDTGITYCGNDSSNSAPCNSTSSDGGTHPRQDATNGRDAKGGGKGFDFTKLDNSGIALNTNDNNWACVRDNVTGLVWEKKTNSGPRNYSHTYSWYKTNPTSGLGVGVVSGGNCEKGGRCDTEKFVDDVNAAQLCGASDWRMPTVKELEGLVNFSRQDPAIDTDYFPTTADDFWTSTVDASLSGSYAWFVDFLDGRVTRQVFGTGNRVRLVRGTAVPSQLVVTDSGTTVTDNSTGLMWKRNYEMRGNTAAPWGVNTDKFNWSEALKRAVTDTTGGHTDWRLPNIKELRSLTDHTRFFPAIDTTAFPITIGSNGYRTTMQGYFWSSSPFLDYFGTTDQSWIVGGDYGQNSGNERTYVHFVRLVRDADTVGVTVPDAPTNLVATSGDASVSIDFNAPASPGGAAAIDEYLATCTAGSSVLTGKATTSPVSVTGMANGTVYSCVVAAHNSAGYGIASTSASVTPVAGACGFSLNQSSYSSISGAFSGNVNLTTAATCGWTAVSNNGDWLTVVSGSPGTGSGSVTYSATANTTTAARNGTLTIGGQTFTYKQAGLPACSYTLDTKSTFFKLAEGGPGSVSVTAATHCAWEVVSNATWISPKNLTGTGNGVASYTVDANANAVTRSGTLTIAGVTYTLAQAGTGTPTGSRLINFSTRGQVQAGNDVMIGGFVIQGSTPKKVLIRAVGPSLASFGVAGFLLDPTLQLYAGQALIASNDNWGSATNFTDIQSTGLAPGNTLESAILTTLAPGAYTAIVSGNGGGTGVGMVEVYELDHPETALKNISTRGQVQTGDNVMIGGFIIQGDSPQTVLIRAVGPNLANYGVTGVLANPMLQLNSGQTVIATNDDWQFAANADLIYQSGLAPVNPLESAILITLQPGAYTAIVSGTNGGTGVGIMEVFAQ